MGIKKQKKMSTIFVFFLVKIVLGIVLSVIVPISILSILLWQGIILPANYCEIVAKAEAEKLESTTDLMTCLESMPGFIYYLVCDENYEILKTNMEPSQQEYSIAYVRDDARHLILRGNVQNHLVERPEGKVLLQYTIKAHYVNGALEAVLPSPDILMLVLMFVLALVSSAGQVHLLAIRFRKELNPLIKVAKEIADQNLEGDIPQARIKEIGEILKSFGDMKEELKVSLKKQWEMQQTQKEQVAALAHDLKTPMTITMGNLDLLRETELQEEQCHLVEDALSGMEQLTNYVGLLTEMTMASTQYEYQFRDIQLSEFLDTIGKKAELICQKKQIEFCLQKTSVLKDYNCDPDMLERALMNVIQNAVEYTPQNGKICFMAEETEKQLRIEIVDTGIGFSEKMLKDGVKLFAMDEDSRTGRSHYGMGLYFAASVIEKHNGEIHLSNDKMHGGARILIILNINL